MKDVFAKTRRGVLLACLELSLSPLAGHAAGTVVGWGNNDHGQTESPSGLSNVVAIAAGGFHSLALTAGGQVIGWGDSFSGQTESPSGLSNVVAIAAGGNHSLALTADGRVVGWGAGAQVAIPDDFLNYGQTMIPSGLSNVVAISAGWFHSLALTAEGRVVAWGENSSGQTNAPSGLSNVVAIAAGWAHSLALTAEGRVVAWGENYDGQTNVPSGLSNVVAIAAGAGASHSLALTAAGQVVAWGYNAFGQTDIPSGLSNVVAVAGGAFHSLALTAQEGRVAGWGWDDGGQTDIPSGLSNVVAIAGGFWHSLALTSEGAPTILSQPLAQSVTAGGTVAFQVRAVGPPPLRYQWRKEGVPLPEGTNSTIALTGVTTNATGNYDVVVSNGLGSAQSSLAVLQVLPDGAPSIRVNGQLAVGTVSALSAAVVTIAGGFTDGQIFYTLDGAAPNPDSTRYSGPFSLTTSATLLAMSLSADLVQTSVAPAVTVLVVPTYSLLTSVIGNGAIVASPARASYPSNSVVTLTAQPSVHHAFDHWSGDLAGSANPATLTMSGPRSVQAVFAASDFPLTLSTPGGGTVSADGLSIAPNTYYPANNLVSLAAGAEDGWSFLRWEGSVNSTDNPLLLAMDQSHNVQGIFGTVVRTEMAGNGAVLLSPDNPVPYGTTVTATAVPAPGGSFMAWSGAASGTDNPTTFMVTNATPMTGAEFAGPPAPAILTQPTNMMVVLGNSATFTVMASGATPLTYQWRQGTNDITDATNSTYMVVSTTEADAGDYEVVVSDAYASATSAVAVLTVLIPPSITSRPQSLLVLVGSKATFSVGAEGTLPLTCQWFFNGSMLANATNSQFSITHAQPSDVGNYFVVVANSSGSATSSTATLAVSYQPAVSTGGTVVGWGYNQDGQTNIPSGLSNVVAIAGGYAHSLALTAEGRVVGWGRNDSGQTTVPDWLSNAVAIAAGAHHSLALSAEGRVVGWGWNDAGQTTVPDGLSNVVAVAGGYAHSLALTAEGRVVGWGRNDSGQTTVPDWLSNVVAIAAGYRHSLALTVEGGVAGWGEITMPSGLSNAVAIAGGAYSGLALTAEGGVVGWGYNAFGQVNIPGGLSNVVAIAGGLWHGLALTGDGRVVGWGNDDYGQTDLPSGLSNVVGIAGGFWHSLALTSDSTLNILSQPLAQSVTEGGTVAFRVGAVGPPPPRYQWRKDGAPLPEETNSTITLTEVTTDDAGNYDVVVSNAYGAVASRGATLSVTGTPVTITRQPAAQVVPFGGTATFSVEANGDPAPSYQWLFNGEIQTGATDSSLVITNAGTNVLGEYSVVAWNAHSAATSSVARLWMPPSLSSGFVGGTNTWGKSAALSMSALGSGELTYQWFKDGEPISWGTNATLEFPAIQFSDAGLYSLVVSNPWGSATNTPARLMVTAGNLSLAMYAGVTVEGVAGYTYAIQYTTNLANTNSWVSATNFTLTAPVETWVDLESIAQPRRFYRIIPH